jgi:hypothetical protein
MFEAKQQVQKALWDTGNTEARIHVARDVLYSYLWHIPLGLRIEKLKELEKSLS